VAILALCMVAACSSGGSGGRRGPDYEPVPDDVLLDRAARVDGVEDITVSYNDDLGDRGYDGELICRGSPWSGRRTSCWSSTAPTRRRHPTAPMTP